MKIRGEEKFSPLFLSIMQKILDYIFGAFIFLSSVFYLPGQNFHDSQKQLFKIVGMLFFAIFLCRKPLREIRNCWVNSYLILSIAIFFAVKPAQMMAIGSLINVFMMVMVFYVFANYLKDDSIIYKAIQGIIVLNIIMVILQLLGIDPLVLNDQRKQNINPVGLFGHPMNMGIFCSVVLPYVFSKSKLWAIPAMILMIFSGSYASIVLGFLGLLVYIYFVNRKLFKFITILTIVILGIGFGIAWFSSSNTEQGVIMSKFFLRYEVNYPIFKVALSNPFTGYGLGMFPYIIPKIKDIDIGRIGYVDVTWNDYLGCMLEMGVMVLFIFYGFFKQVLIRFKKSSRSNELCVLFASLSTIPIGIFFHSYMNYINVGIICIALYALFEMKLSKEE